MVKRYAETRCCRSSRESPGQFLFQLTADLEAGYGENVADIADTAMRVISAGAVGLNFEDSTKKPENPLYDVEGQVQKIAMIRKVANLLDVPLVINARTDALFAGKGDSAGRLREAIVRGKEYLKSGADCFFPVGATDPHTISEIVRQVCGPVNILATRDVPLVAELKRLGVRRVSVGSGAQRATLGLAKRIARELRERGTYESLLNGAPTLAEANRLVARS